MASGAHDVFLETFVLRDDVPGYRAFDDRFAFLFNSYYEGEGDRHPRARRGMISRPTLDQVRAWRRQVDDAVSEAFDKLPAAALELIELAIQHEQQHQELFLTDILATFAENPLEPAYLPTPSLRGGEADAAIHKQERTSATAHGLPRFARNDGWVDGAAGVIEIGAPATGFAFDCERPRHPALLHPHAIAATCVTNAEWQAFIDDGGYANPALWLSEGWDWVRREGITAPLYWHRDGTAFTLAGRKPIDPAAPVAHVSFYEADAFARWAGARLPTEAEWEAFAAHADPQEGHQLDRAEAVAPRPRPPRPVRRRLAMDPPPPFCLSPVSPPPKARWANIMASSCAGSSC